MKHLLTLLILCAMVSTAPAGAQINAYVYLPLVMSSSTGNVPYPTPIAPTTTPVIDDLTMRREVIRLVNEYRVANGCPAAIENAALMNGAQAWSDYMRANNYFEHSSTVDFNWYRERGYTLASVAENLGMGQETPQRIVDAWKASPNHNRTLLSCRYSNDSSMYDVGVGLNGRLWTFALGERLP